MRTVPPARVDQVERAGMGRHQRRTARRFFVTAAYGGGGQMVHTALDGGITVTIDEGELIVTPIHLDRVRAALLPNLQKLMLLQPKGSPVEIRDIKKCAARPRFRGAISCASE